VGLGAILDPSSPAARVGEQRGALTGGADLGGSGNRCFGSFRSARIFIAGLFFVILPFFFWLCASVMPLGQYVVAEAECFGISAILIYTPYRKK
jgi:hypothetical protein